MNELLKMALIALAAFLISLAVLTGLHMAFLAGVSS